MKIKGKKKKRRLLPRLAILVLAVIGAVLWFRWQCWGIQTTVTEVTLEGLPQEFDGLRIVHLSDLHGHEYGEGSEELLAKVAAQEPDLIAVTGDLIDQAVQFDMVVPLAEGLAAIAPTFYVTGNHEWYVGDVPQLKAMLEEAGVTVLSNEYVTLERGDSALILAGVDDPNGYADQKTPEALYEEIAEQLPDTLTLLLAHRNDRFDQYAAAGYDLVLSGHAHGGIVRLPFTDGLVGTDRKLFPTRTAGLYTEGDSTLFVSRGLGNNTTPIHGFRIFNRPDLAVLVLKTSH